MRRFTGVEKSGLGLASVIVIGGLLMIARPVDMAVLHPGPVSYTGGGSAPLEPVSKQQAREIGVGAVLVGVVFASFVLCRPRE